MANSISKSALKARMLEVFRRIEETGEELIITHRGVPVLKVVPIEAQRSVDEIFGEVRGGVVYHADLLETTEDEWSET